MHTLKEFDTISLSEINEVKLLDRVDTKFLFNRKDLTAILSSIKSDYKVLTIDDRIICDYSTLYFDTEKFELYLSHHNGKANRVKVRFREYIGSNVNYFEVKVKNNKGRTIKHRIKRLKIENTLSRKSKLLLKENTKLKANNLKPVFYVNYSRITFVNLSLNERLTMDLNLEYKMENFSKIYQPLIIAELKQNSFSMQSPFAKVMSASRIKKKSISKYCLGVTQLYPHIKNNNYKTKILTINKIIDAND